MQSSKFSPPRPMTPSPGHRTQQPFSPRSQTSQPSTPRPTELQPASAHSSTKNTELSSPSAPPCPTSHEASTSPGDVPVSHPPASAVSPPDATQAVTTTTTSTQWSTGLCECFSDVPNCLITCFCPCITFGEISEIIDKGTSSCAINGAVYALLAAAVGCACIYSAIYRRRLRHQYNLEGNDIADCCVHSCCEICALTQEYRELRLRGFDLSLGWQANNDGQNQDPMTLPPPHASMRR